MSKTLIGLIFILTGLVYGSMAIDNFYNHTLGWLVENKWVTPPKPGQNDLKEIIGRKPTIILYSLILILIGIFIIWKQ